MFKKIAIFLVLVLMIGALSACTPSGRLTQVKLTESQKADIERAYLTYALRPNIVAYDSPEKTAKDALYFGNYNGAELVILEGAILYAYKDGQFAVPEEGAPSTRQMLQGEVKLSMTADESKLKEIENKWLEKRLKDFESMPDVDRWNWNEESGCFCYGKNAGYYILYLTSSMGTAVVTETEIAGQVFKAGRPFELLAYKDGTIYDLASLYEEGKISVKAIEKIAEMHKERFSSMYAD